MLLRDGNAVVVSVIDDREDLLTIPGVTCTNPEALPSKRQYEKRFVKRKIFFPEEESLAQAVLTGRNVIRVGMTGYTSISPQNCADWGIKVGAYEAACGAVLTKMVMHLRENFPGCRIKVVHGASNMGIDKVIIEVANRLNLDMVGFNCLEWLFYVEDEDDFPVYVASTKAQYADAFIRNLDILLSAGGRIQALEHDMLAAIKYDKRLMILNLVKTLSANGGPPARDGAGKIQDASAAFEQCIFSDSTVSYQRMTDPFGDLLERVKGTSVHLARQLLSPEEAYGFRP